MTKLEKLWLFFATLIALSYRFTRQVFPLWVDEFSTADQARLILQYGLGVFTNPDIFFEYHNITSHFLVAFTHSTLGASTFSTKLPFMIIGSLVPALVYLLARKIFDKAVALPASLLSIFSYFFITWSRQARSYVIVQTLVLLLFFLYFNWLENIGSKKGYKYLGAISLVAVLGVLTHVFFYLGLISLGLHFLFIKRKTAFEIISKPIFLLILAFLLITIYITGIFDYGLSYLKLAMPLGIPNNLPYYHSFLWRNYGLITFMGLVGLGLALLNNFKKVSLLVIHLIVSLIFLSFVFDPRVTRYLLPIFPSLFIGVGFTLDLLTKNSVKNIKFLKNFSLAKYLAPAVLAIFIILNGNTFVAKPKAFYSVNHDFREIALIDYNQIYGLIASKVDLSKGETAIIDTWADRAMWYVGHDYPALFVFRWADNGLMRRTPFELNNNQEKVVIKKTNFRLISELADLEKVMSEYPTGFIWIDDATLPSDVVNFVEKSLQKELYLDHYPLDDNPLSIWPGTLYSWGVSDG